MAKKSSPQTPAPLGLDALAWQVPASLLPFEHTGQLDPTTELPGQGEVLDDLTAALARPVRGHVLLTGINGADRRERVAAVVRARLSARGAVSGAARGEGSSAARGAVSSAARDLVYVARPQDPSRPRLVELPAGRANAFRRDLLELRDELRLAWPDDLDAGPGAWAAAIDRTFAPMQEAWPQAADFLAELHEAVQARSDLFRPGMDPQRRGREGDLEAAELLAAFRAHVFHRGQVGDHAPVIIAMDGRPDPLFGGIHRDIGRDRPAHSRLRSGLLHDAHGGVLIIDGRDMLRSESCWRRLRVALTTGALAPDNLKGSQVAGLRPDAVPLDVQVVLIAWSGMHIARWSSDPDLRGLFSLPIQLRPHAPLSSELGQEFGAWLAGRLQANNARHLDADAVAAVLEHLVHLGGRGGRVPLALSEAEELALDGASRATGDRVGRAEIQAARADWERRRRLAWDRAIDSIERDLLRVETDGGVVGQANGLAVYRGSGFAFARPIRITATVGAGRGGLVDVERDVGLSGKLHQKGVRILTGFLRGRFSRHRTLAIQASIGIEQHYGRIDGDSASLAEACVLISAIGHKPLRQGRAITGSIDQLGRVQSVGSVTQKVEGFFAICQRRGLTGDQGVLVPAQNAPDLCLSHEVLDAVAEGQFHIWPVHTVEEALSLLVDMPVGDPDARAWPEGSLYGAVDAELAELELVLRRAAKGPGTK